MTPNFPIPRNITLYLPSRITNFKNPFAVVSAGRGLGAGAYLLVFHPHPWIPASLFLLLTTAHKDAHPLPWLHFPESRVSWPRPKRENTIELLMWVDNTRTGYAEQILLFHQRGRGLGREGKQLKCHVEPRAFLDMHLYLRSQWPLIKTLPFSYLILSFKKPLIQSKILPSRASPIITVFCMVSSQWVVASQAVFSQAASQRPSFSTILPQYAHILPQGWKPSHLLKRESNDS